MDAGHGISGRMNSILFNEDLVNAQCRQCNRLGSGELQMYKKVLIDVHGQEKWEYWQSTKNRTVKYTPFDYEQIARTYRGKAKQLKDSLIRPLLPKGSNGIIKLPFSCFAFSL
jgi:hypothetical protein